MADATSDPTDIEAARPLQPDRPGARPEVVGEKLEKWPPALLRRRHARPDRWAQDWARRCGNDVACHDDKVASLDAMVSARDEAIAKARSTENRAVQARRADEARTARREAAAERRREDAMAKLSDAVALNIAPPAPSATEIQGVIQARLDVAFQTLDAIGDACKTFRRNDNPLEAVACLLSGGGAMNSQSSAITVTSVELDRCSFTQDETFLCRYLANARMTGTGLMDRVARIFDTTRLFNGHTWSTFRNTDAGWQLEQTYERCTPYDGGHDCVYTR